jgi:hypothetical protein
MRVYPLGVYETWDRLGYDNQIKAYVDENPGQTVDEIAKATSLSREIVLWAVRQRLSYTVVDNGVNPVDIGQKLEVPDVNVTIPETIKVQEYAGADRIKNAIYSWWIHPLAFYEKNYRHWTVMGALDSTGKRQIHALDHDAKTVETFTLNSFDEADDHDAPAIIKRKIDYKIMAIYTRHNRDNLIRVRIAKKADSISEFEDEITAECSDTITYIQAFQYGSEVHVFYRVVGRFWAHRIFETRSNTWGDEQLMIDGGSHYIKFMTVPGVDNTIRFVVQGHPVTAQSHHSRVGAVRINTVGDGAGEIMIITPTSSVVVGNLLDDTSPVSLSTSYGGDAIAVPEPTLPVTRRLLDLAHSEDMTFVYAEINQDTKEVEYKVATRSAAAWNTFSLMKTRAVVYEGVSLYIGGATFLPGRNDIIHLIHQDETNEWLLERWEFTGTEWTKISTLARGSQKHIRPIMAYPDYNSDMSFKEHDNRVYYQVGRYEAFANMNEIEDYKTDILWSVSEGVNTNA